MGIRTNVIDGFVFNTVLDRLQELETMKVQTLSLSTTLTQSELDKSSFVEQMEKCKMELEASRALAKERIKKQTELEGEIISLRSSLNVKEGELSQLKRVNERLDTNEREKDRILADFNSQITTLKEALTLKDNQLANLNSEVQTLQSTIDEGGEKLVTLEAELSHLKNENETLHSYKLEKDENLADLNSQLETLKDTLKSKEGELVNLNSEVDTLKSTLEERAEKLVTLEAELTSLKDDLRDKNNELVLINKEINRLHKLIDIKDEQLKSKEVELADTTETIDKHLITIGIEKSKNEELVNDIDILRTGIGEQRASEILRLAKKKRKYGLITPDDETSEEEIGEDGVSSTTVTKHLKPDTDQPETN